MRWKATNSEIATFALRGQAVFVVEDEPVIAMDLAAILFDAGASVVGPCGEADECLELARSAAISIAVLDVRIGRQSVAPVAEALEQRGIPFLFYSGQVETDAVRKAWPEATFVPKPAPTRRLVSALAALGGRAAAVP